MASSDISDEQQQAAARITLGLLNAVDGDRAVTQRRIAADLGIAVGLVNAYLKRCVNKGLIKVQQVPRRRYAYYLTPKGFAEKSRLTASYLLYSFDFFRQARASCEEALGVAAARGWKSLILVGRSDMAEIALVCALHHPLRVVALVDVGADGGEGTFASLPLVSKFGAVAESFDGALITDIVAVQTAYDAAVAELGAARVLVPALLAQAFAAPEKSGGDA
jgi:DNA-binding MarR family transcriptional regulator